MGLQANDLVEEIEVFYSASDSNISVSCPASRLTGA